MTQQIEKLLNDVGFRLATLREARNRFSDQLAPEFRIFDYLRTDEMGLSRCIASLLDPKGKHGQGSVFLDAFMKNIGIDWVTNAKDCQVTLEKQANGQRRIDIFLEFPNGIVGIENKPWTVCQDKQLIDYAEYLEKYSGRKNWLLIFLSNRDPEEKSLTPTKRAELEDDQRFIQLSYNEIIDWLEVCACKSRAPVVRVFIEELAKFIRTNINGEVEMSDEKEINSAVLKSSETLGSAFQIVKAMDSIKKDLLNKFHNDLEKGLKDQNLLLVDWTVDRGKKPTGFDVQFGDKEQSLNLRFDFETLSLDKFTWGIWKKNGEYKNPDVWEKINSLLNTEFYSGKSSPPWWPWYSECPNADFDGEMRNWSISEKPWIMINNGELASKIVELAVKVRDAFLLDDRLCLLNEEFINATQQD
jgi:hypothetical protein